MTLGLLAAIVGGCGASTPKQASVAPPAVVVPSPAGSARAPVAALAPVAEGAHVAAPYAPAGAARAERRGNKRAELRVDRGGASNESPALEPISESMQLAYDRALAALRSEDWLQAELELEQITHDYPAYPGPQVNLAIVYLHDGRRDEARAALDRALAVAPGHAAANNQLGILLREEGKFDEAEHAYRRALEADPGYALAHYNLGVLLDVYLRRGAEAIEHYEMYQASLSEPDKTVAGWLIDLRRRFSDAGAPRVAKENGE